MNKTRLFGGFFKIMLEKFKKVWYNMIYNNTQKIVVLKDIPSNLIEEAILILKTDKEFTSKGIAPETDFPSILAKACSVLKSNTTIRIYCSL